jgi:hypothetical protein
VRRGSSFKQVIAEPGPRIQAAKTFSSPVIHLSAKEEDRSFGLIYGGARRYNFFTLGAFRIKSLQEPTD